MIVLLAVLSFVYYTSAIKSHQFHFSGGNVAYGDVPHLVHIVGYWYVNKLDPNFQPLIKAGYDPNTDLKGNLYVCKTNIESKYRLINEGAESDKQKKIRLMLLQKASKERVGSISPYINVNGCELLATADHEIHYDQPEIAQKNVKRFSFYHNFTVHEPLLFVDAWGVAAFQYRAKESDALKMKYCENDDSSFPVIFNKRPVCPRTALKSTIVDDGRLTVFKANILSVQKKANHCFIEYTYIHTYGNTVWNEPLVKKVYPMSVEDCKFWIEHKTCRIPNLYTGELVHVADFEPVMTQITKTRLSTTNKITMKHHLTYTMKYTIVNCIVDIGFIRTTPPFQTLITPWDTISNDYLYNSSYTQMGGEVIVWDAFKKEDICNYVPMASMQATRITYNSKDYLEQDPHPGATEMYQFVSDADKSVYVSDNTQITNIELFNCIEKEENQTLYTINNGLILSWENGVKMDSDDEDSLFGTSDKMYHPHSAYVDLTHRIDDSCENDDDCGDFLSDVGSNELFQKSKPCDPNSNPKCRQSYSIEKIKEEIGRSKSVEKKVVFNKSLGIDDENVTPLFSIVNYIQYKWEEFHKQDIIRRAQTWCENQQHLYDIQLLLARISPSTIISSYLNRPAQATSIGNGVYSTHYCQTIQQFLVVDSLVVNNTEQAPYLAGKTFADVYASAGVTISPRLCFTMPIVVFKNSYSIDDWKIGQLQPDQTISTISYPYIEECKFGRTFFHLVDDHIHVFQNYKRISITPIEVLYNHASRIKETHDHLNKLKNNETTNRNQIDPLLESTEFIDIFTKQDVQKIKPMVLGFRNTELYSYHQKRRVISSLEDLIAYANEERFNDRVLTSLTQGFESKSGGGANWFKDAMNEIGNGLKILTDVGVGVIGHAIDNAGGLVGKTLGSLDQALGSAAGFVSGGFMQMLLPIAAVAVLAFFGYLFMKKKLMSDDDETHYQSYQNMPPPSFQQYGNMRRRYNSCSELQTEF